MKDKLSALIQEAEIPVMNGKQLVGIYALDEIGANALADHLIANGVTVQRWIPVTERLPNYGERVLATDGVVVGEMYFAITKHWHRYNGISWKNFADTQITHWMPLPDAPKEVAE